MPSCEESQAEPCINGAFHAERHGPPPRPVRGGEWMIGKFASVLSLLILTILLGGQGFAQATPSGQFPSPAAPAPQEPAAQQPAAQQPAAQQPASDQEPAEGESSSRRKAKPRDFKNWSYNVGLGANLDGGTTREFVRE